MASNKVFSFAIGREIVQVVFRPTLKWLTDRSRVASELEKKYEEWRSDNGNVALFSPSKKNVLEVFTTNVTFVSEEELDSEKGFDDISKILPSICKTYDIKEIRRVGCRRTCIFSSKFEFSDITNLIHKRLFITNTSLESIQGKNINDLNYALDSEVGGVKSHVQIGAVKKEEGLKAFSSKFDQNPTLDSENNLFVDLDISISAGLSHLNVIEQLKKVQATNHSTISGYLDYLMTE